MEPGTPYVFLRDFWKRVVAPAPSRHTIVATLREGDLWLRDGYAVALVRESLHRVDRVEYRHVRAWGRDAVDPLPSSDIVILGRHAIYFHSALRDHVNALEPTMRGVFDPGARGALGNSLSYKTKKHRHVFVRHDLEQSPEGHRRSDLDYAVLQIAKVTSASEERRMICLAGISGLGTTGLAMILADPGRCKELAAQVEETGPRLATEDVPDYFELCVRIKVADDIALEHFLDRREFEFEVEVVIVGNEEPRLRDERTDLTVRQTYDGKGEVTVKGDAQPLTLSKGRYRLLRRLIESPDATTTPELCAVFDIPDPSGSGAVLLAKRVHDLNAALRKLAPFQNMRPVHTMRRKHDNKICYVLEARGILDERT
jgi:hypothetical protein